MNDELEVARDALVEERADAAREVLQEIGFEVCTGCKEPMDPSVCWCGSDCGSRDGHPFVAMGCKCLAAQTHCERCGKPFGACWCDVDTDVL